MNNYDLLCKARETARDAHRSIGQLRKYTGQDYIVHPLAVEAIFAEYHPDNIAGRIACLAHDILEDVYPENPFYSPEWMRAEWGDEVFGYVFDVTDQYTKLNYPKWNRKLRNQKERERHSLCCPTSKDLKLSDIIQNTSSIIDECPEFAPTYLREKELSLPYLTGGNSHLWIRAAEQIQRLLKSLE